MPLIGHVRRPNRVVQLHGLGRFVLGKTPLRTENEALGHGRAHAARRIGQTGFQGPDCLGAADVTQRYRRR